MIKIIGGKYKGKSLSVIKGNIVRPTSLIKKQAIFNILMSYFLKKDNKKKFTDKIILDAYAGTGALGLEALSRGSKFCYFIDKDKKVIKKIKNTCIIIIENDKSNPLPEIKNMKIINEKKFGKTRITFMNKN